MTIEHNKNLFYILAGLVLTGADAYDHNDADITALVDRIRKLNVPHNINDWFTQARTGQVSVNPYWPRGSCLASACFYIKEDIFDIDAFFTFIRNTGNPDPIGYEDFCTWVSRLPEILTYCADLPAMESLWGEYCRIVSARIPEWEAVIEKANGTTRNFFGENAPALSFAPNLLSAYSTDFVSLGSRMITIAPAPDMEGMLHETLHPVVAEHREKIKAFAEKYGLCGFADREKMMEFGYMHDDSPASVTHVIEECFVRASAVLLSGKGEERLRAHAAYGCISVPRIGAYFKSMRPTTAEFGTFIDTVLAEMETF